MSNSETLVDAILGVAAVLAIVAGLVAGYIGLRRRQKKEEELLRRTWEKIGQNLQQGQGHGAGSIHDRGDQGKRNG